MEEALKAIWEAFKKEHSGEYKKDEQVQELLRLAYKAGYDAAKYESQ